MYNCSCRVIWINAQQRAFIFLGDDNEMDMAEYFYYNIVYGCMPDEVTDDDIKQTDKTIQYMIDNGVTEDVIIDILGRMPRKRKIDPSDIPDSLWKTNENLLKRDSFYYHNKLRLVAPAPIFNVKTGIMRESKFYLEMKMTFTLKDLRMYYESRFPKVVEDAKATNGALKYLLDNYKNAISGIEAIDIVLMLIDTAYADSRSGGMKPQNPLDLKKYEEQVVIELKRIKEEADLKNNNKIIWR